VLPTVHEFLTFAGLRACKHLASVHLHSSCRGVHRERAALDTGELHANDFEAGSRNMLPASFTHFSSLVPAGLAIRLLEEELLPLEATEATPHTRANSALQRVPAVAPQDGVPQPHVPVTADRGER
jgi:hypothetical protein